MPLIPVSIPGMLRHAIDGQQSVVVEAGTLAQLIGEVQRRYPLLVPLVWDETLVLRRHVLIFYNDTSTRWLESPDVALKEGDRVAIVQAISGG